MVIISDLKYQVGMEKLALCWAHETKLSFIIYLSLVLFLKHSNKSSHISYQYEKEHSKQIKLTISYYKKKNSSKILSNRNGETSLMLGT